MNWMTDEIFLCVSFSYLGAGVSVSKKVSELDNEYGVHV